MKLTKVAVALRHIFSGKMNSIGIHQEDWFNSKLADGGPIYAETNFDFIIVEPWNAISSIVMMLPAIIWVCKLYPSFREYWFLTLLLPLGFLGGLGSTLFHAFRAFPAFLLLDVVPSAILTLLLTIYLWYRIVHKWYFVVVIILASIGLRFLLYSSDIPEHMSINLAYAFTGLLIALPLILLLIGTSFYRIRDVAIAISCFILALFFREIDAYNIIKLHMGTHFLWHIFSAVGSYYIYQYLYYLTKRELQTDN